VTTVAEDVEGPGEIHRVHRVVDAELEEAEAGADPPGEDDSEREELLVRLRGLRGAVVAMETYEDGLRET